MLGLLSQGPFRNLFLAGLSSNFVRWFEVLFVGVFVFNLTQSPLLTAIAAMMRYIPLAPASVVFGSLGDILGRRRLYLIVTSAVVAATATQCLLAATGLLAFWHILLGALFSGLHWSMDLPVRRAMMGESVADAAVAPAMALDAAASNAMRMLGPLLGGAALAWMGIAAAFLIGTVLYSLSLLLVYRFAEAEPPRIENAPPRFSLIRLSRRMAGGFRIARAHPDLMAIFVITVLFNVFAFPALSMIPVIGEDLLGLSPMMIAVLASAEGMGAFAGSLLIARYVSGKQHYARVYWGGAFVAMAMAALFATSPGFAMAWLSLLLMGLGVAGFSVMQSTLAFVYGDQHTHGRFMGLMSCGIGTAPLGLVSIGWISSAFGPASGILVLAGLGTLLLVAVVRRWQRQSSLAKGGPNRSDLG